MDYMRMRMRARSAAQVVAVAYSSARTLDLGSADGRTSDRAVVRIRIRICCGLYAVGCRLWGSRLETTGRAAAGGGGYRYMIYG